MPMRSPEDLLSKEPTTYEKKLAVRENMLEDMVCEKGLGSCNTWWVLIVSILKRTPETSLRSHFKPLCVHSEQWLPLPIDRKDYYCIMSVDDYLRRRRVITRGAIIRQDTSTLQ